MEILSPHRHHLQSSISLQVMSTPTKIMRKLSHSKIMGYHLPHLLKSGDPEKNLSAVATEDDNHDHDGPPPQMKRIEKDLTARLKHLPGGKYLGLGFALLASITMSLLTLVVKAMPQYHAFSLVLWRLQGVLLPSLVLLACLNRGSGVGSIFEGVWNAKWKMGGLLVARGVFGCSADLFQYCSLKYLSLADSSVIAFSTPIFVTFVAYFTLGEKIGVVPIFTGVMSLVGVVIISRPPMLTGEESFDTDILIGNALALGCMSMATLTFVLLRKLSTVHFSLSTFSFSFIGSLEALLLCGVTSTWEVPQGGHDWALVVIIALMCFVGQVFFTLALQLEDAGPVALVRSCDVIFAYVWQYAFLGVVPDLFSVVGGAIVISSVMITAFRKFLQELPPEDGRRGKFSFLLR